MAVGSDMALYAFVRHHYAEHGHIGFPPYIAVMAIGFTALTVYAAVAIWRDLRKAHE